MKMKILTLIAASLLPLLFTTGCREAVGNEGLSKKKTARPVLAVRVVEIAGADIRSFPGRAEAAREVNLAFEVPGTLIERRADEGDRVKKGEVLARLDPRDFRNALAAARAEEARALAHYDRIKRAAATGAVSGQDLTNALAALNVAAADVKIRAKAMEDTRLIAPFDGIIPATYVENHQQVLAGQQLLRLLDHSKIEFTVNIPEKMIGKFTGMVDPFVRFDAFPGRDVPAGVKSVGTEASAATRTYPVTLTMDQPKDMEILPGMAGKAYCRADPSLEKMENRVSVPVSALFEKDARSHVWLIDEKNRTVSPKPIVTGAFTRGGIIVENGLTPGLMVATAGVHLLKEGQEIRIMEQEAAR